MNVLVAVDESRYARTAVRCLKGLRLPVNSTVYLLHVIDSPLRRQAPHLVRFSWYKKLLAAEQKKMRPKAAELLARLQKPLQGEKLKIQPLVREGTAGVEIVAAIKQRRINLAVVGTHGLSGIRRFLLGSVSERVLNDAPCSVLVVRGQAGWIGGNTTRGMRILVATDGSPDAQAVVTFLPTLGLPPSSELTVLHVFEPVEVGTPHLGSSFGMTADWAYFDKPPDEILAAQEKAGKEAVEKAQRQLKQPGLGVKATFTKGNVAEEIIRIAEQLRADLVVLGSRGLTGDKRLPLGSISQKVVRHAPCSVLVVKKGA
jgi:nucleotide-binding universal stress UspA family protein